MKYQEFSNKQQNEFNSLPIFFAFNNEQFNEGMKNLGLEPEQTDQIFSIAGGGYIKKTDAPLLHNFNKKQATDKIEFFKDDKNLLEALIYEMHNHEFCYDEDLTMIFDCLGMKAGKLDERTKNILIQAREKYYSQVEY
jgi:hypothetical protein